MPLAACALPLAAIAVAASLAEPCCGVVRTDVAKGLVTVRNRFTGQVKNINDAGLAASLKAGDAIDADAGMGRVTSIKGIARTAALIEPDYAEPCCGIVAVAKDRSIANGLLQGIVTMAGKPYDAVAPFHGVVIAKNNSTGALHVLEMAVDMQAGAQPITAGKPQITAMRTMSKMIDEVKAGDPVDIQGNYGVVRAKGGHYAFKLRGAEGKDKQPWKIEPDPKAEGRYGFVRTDWIEGTSTSNRVLFVYLPGEREKYEYYEVFKTEHSIVEGEYDIKVNGAIIEKVPVKAGNVTRIIMGALRSTGPSSQALFVHDMKGRQVQMMMGGEVVSLPIGTYQVKVGTRMIKIEIKEGEVTDF